MISHNPRTRRYISQVTTFFILTLFIAPFTSFAEPGERRSNIRTGNAYSETTAVHRINTSRTQIEREGTVISIENTNEAQVTTDANAAANTGDNNASAGDAPNTNPLRVEIRDLGLLQLAAHDLFNVDRDLEIDNENGELDLSTLLDHGSENIAIGGEARNRENIILFTVAAKYGKIYKRHISRGLSEEVARTKLLKKYHRELKEVYERVFGEDFPTPTPGAVTQTENLALRTIHDLLPGMIIHNREEIITVDASLIGKKLSQKELEQESDVLDGVFDAVFLDVVITIPPSTVLHISLLERDSSLATQFGTDHSFEHFLEELEDGSYDYDEDVMHYIRNLFAKGLFF